jgi:NAD(P)H-dependent FMN reductase
MYELKLPYRAASVLAAAHLSSRPGSPHGVGYGPRWTLLPSNATMKTLLIVYHSMTGGTRQMAEAAAAGARSEPGLRVSLLPAAEASAAEVLEASGYVFASPENLAAMSGQMKDFFDRSYYPALDRLNGRPYAVMVCAGSDGRNAAQQIERIATGWRLKAIAPPLIVCTHAQTPGEIMLPKVIPASDLQQCEDLGATLAAGTALGIF